MGGIFSKKEKSRITEQDRAILGLKKQRDQLKQYQRRIEGVLEKVGRELFLITNDSGGYFAHHFRIGSLPGNY